MQELSFILETVNSLLASEPAKNLFYSQNFDNQDELHENILLSKEIQRFCQDFSIVTFDELPEIRDQLERTQKGYVLDKEDVYYAYQNLVQWQRIRQLDISEELYPRLYFLVNEIIFPQHLLRHWEKAFDHDQNIADTASTELKRIRGLKKQLRQQIEKFLNKQLQNNEFLAEKRIAFREDRYVLPIKSSAKNRTQGIVHGFSSTGQVAYIEPKEIIDLNNELLSVDDLELREINRLLRMWSDIIAQHFIDFNIIIRRTAFLEVLFGKIMFADRYQASFGQISPDNILILDYVFNPFLLIKKGRQQTVPISLTLDKLGTIISGPNAGGKSASLKTLALCCAMFLKGLPIPAQEISIPFFDKILLEIGDSQSLDDDLSTFSGHLMNIKNILEECSPNTLVLIDEIAHATDPVEGEALGCAIIDGLIAKKTPFAITTHYKKVKIKAFEHDNIKTYSTGFNTKTLSPEFILYPNTIGESYALKIASRVGLSQEIIKKAEDVLAIQKDQHDYLLKNIENFERDLRLRDQEIARKEKQIQTQLESIQTLQQNLEKQQKELQEKGLLAADKELSYCLRELSSIHKKLAAEPKKSQQQLKTIANNIKQKKSEITKLSRPQKTYIKAGDFVFVASLNKKGIVDSVTKNSATVQVGTLKMNFPFSDLFDVTDQEKQNHHTKPQISKKLGTVANSIDLHGYTGDEAIRELESVLYSAYAQNYHEFYIVHGKGTGVLKKRVHDFLKRSPEFNSFYSAPSHMGGDGTTVIRFK